MPDFFIGVDGGGSRTRVAVVDEEGQLHGYAESGGCNPEWLPPDQCRQHLQVAVHEAIAALEDPVGPLRGVVAGLAGINRPDDGGWARDALHAIGIRDTLVCNDRVVARRGALLGHPGVVAIAGTGMVTFAVTESGREVLTWHLGVGGAPGAIALVRDLLARLAAEEEGAADVVLREHILNALGVADSAELRDALVEHSVSAAALAQLAPVVILPAHGCDRGVKHRGIRAAA